MLPVDVSPELTTLSPNLFSSRSCTWACDAQLRVAAKTIAARVSMCSPFSRAAALYRDWWESHVSVAIFNFDHTAPRRTGLLLISSIFGSIHIALVRHLISAPEPRGLQVEGIRQIILAAHFATRPSRQRHRRRTMASGIGPSI